MSAHPIETTPQAYGYPLLIKQLLHSAMATAPQQEIVYADQRRHTYTDSMCGFSVSAICCASAISGPAIPWR